MNKALLGIMVVVALSGCRANQEPLQDFILKTQQSASTQVSKLQAEQTFKASEFNPLSTRAPFALPKIAVVQTQPSLVKDCWQPSSRRKNGKLERFALTQLQLKGVMGSGNSVSGIIQVPTGQVVKVKKGHYLGLNNGKIIKITPKHLTIQETLPDGLGCWQQRNVKLALK
ncbi:putative Pilus assembly protein PilP [Vibrio nigripulchritudo MADA3029]|uniref:pilus assembly protein PilP n=1 Tax=Vibrio nigripulchritudo TaxID=28173 RepID=UPI0003B2361A|nr:pilus assembly protein PilP [Vibrio nigripulchritudo]CCN47801.1 putative Pilus assembly protein PilP [Vibrio nigripulchritudo MADA3020]CCN55660.1 putative Pilus assembly protein PilP [Vibrio nigripulchritudo MADA3021]CCN62428.1 putative Pilus assembly protein PilP [Vibrio nigripulchritudo MADA3029]BCL71401.1 fimbrial protein [Vibrio nigripulchritudo]BDU32758.1 fimbrial protein [Vibrio nigripulchritudo]